MQINVSSGADFERCHIPAKTYKGVLKECRPGQIKDFEDPTQMRDVIWWTFTVTHKKQAYNLDGMTTTATGAKSKLRAWVKALGTDIKPGGFDLADLYGKTAFVAVADKDRNGEVYSRIADVFASDDDEDEAP